MSRCPTCEKSARAERAAARARGELEGGSVDRNGRLVVYTDEERARRSELARRLHAEGRFGGAVIGRSGGRGVQRHRIADAVLDHFRQEDKQKLVVNAYESALKGKNKSLRVRAADSIMRSEKEQDERLSRDRGNSADPSSMTQEELEEFVRQGLEAAIERGEISADVVVESDATDDVIQRIDDELMQDEGPG